MIKVKILNPTKCRNEPTFRPLLFVKDMLRDCSIDITDSNDYDFLFVGMKDFYDRTQDIINSKVPKIATTIDYRIRNAFSINKDGTVNKLPLLEKQVTDAKGKVVLKKGKPIIKQFKPTIQDIAARYPEYVGALNSKQIRALESVQDELLPTSQLWNEFGKK